MTPRAKPGTEITLRSVLYYRGFGTVEGRFPFDNLFTIAMADLPPSAAVRLPDTHRSSAWSHPLHLHGFFFQVLDEHGSPAKPMAWKDTVNIPFDQTVRFDDRAGSWMFHCHILDHAEGGLMGMVDVGNTHTSHEQH